MDVTQHILLALIVVPFLGFLFALMSRGEMRGGSHNVMAVVVFAALSNIFLLWQIFSRMDISGRGLQFISRYNWIDVPHIELALGIDIFALMILLAVHLILIICIPFVRETPRPKMLGCLSLLFLSMITGFLVAADIFSFYIFFTALLVPLFLLMGTVGEIRKQSWMFRFFIYNFIGGIILFLVVASLYYYQNRGQAILLDEVARFRLSRPYEYWVWGGIFAALLSRIPIWPFHYWIASVNGAVQNPLVFLAVNLIPLTGVYGLVRFCPKTVPESVSYLLTGLEVVAVVSMLFIAMIGLINKDSRYKLFSFMTVYYIVFLLGALLPTNKILLNIGYSLFAFLIIVAVLEVLLSYIQREQQRHNLHLFGILCHTPRIALLYSFFTLAAVGFPLSALFINNFVIVSYLFRYNFNLSIVIMAAVIISSAGLLQELYLLKDSRYLHPNSVCLTDISQTAFYGLGIVVIMLLVSLFNPLLVWGG